MDIYIDVQKSRIITDNPELLRSLVELYSFRIPGSEFTPSYRRKQWDGKKRFITKAGIFRTGMLAEVLSALKKIDCIPKLHYKYKKSPTIEFEGGVSQLKNITYYDFQEKFIEKALMDQRGIIKAPTGSGKTLIIAGILQSLFDNNLVKSSVILFTTKQLLQQTYDFLKKLTTLEDRLGVCFGEGYEDGEIMLCTIQSIHKLPDLYLQAESLLVEEAHEFPNGEITLAAIQSFPRALYRFGFTATPPSDPIPKYNLMGAIGPTWEKTSTLDLIDEGKLTRPIIQFIKIGTDEEHAEELSYDEIYADYIVNNEERNQKIVDICNHISTNNKKARILILVKDLQHMGNLVRMLPGSHFLSGEDDLFIRYSVINKFLSAPGPSILIGTKIFQTGVNIEEITHLINARGLKSKQATLQALGRALRKHKSKDRAFIYDFMDESPYLRAHARKRRKHYEEEGHEVIIL